MWCVRLRQLINNTRFTTTKYIKSERWVSSESAAVVSADHDNKQQQQQQQVKVSKAMKAYQERAQEHEAFMFEEWSEYEIGKRHLANIMGEDPQTFTQEDVNASIQYLLPSGLFEPLVRPHLSPPCDVFTKRKEAEFDIAGRPHHTLFYTAIPTFYQVMHDLTGVVKELDRFEDRMKKYSVKQEQQVNVGFASSQWVTKEELENILLEQLKDKHYEFFLESMKRLLTHTYSHRANDFIMRFRKSVKSVLAEKEVPKLLYTAEGRPYMSGVGKRKLSLASVTVYGRGTGNITINENNNILYFDNIQCREQVIYPLQFTGLLGLVDVVCDVEGGGPCGQAGAIRYALSQALMSFTDKEMVEKMRLGGLLTRDPRMKERNKPGQKGARAQYTWKKR